MKTSETLFTKKRIDSKPTRSSFRLFEPPKPSLPEEPIPPQIPPPERPGTVSNLKKTRYSWFFVKILAKMAFDTRAREKKQATSLPVN